jgi:hypothetical protein
MRNSNRCIGLAVRVGVCAVFACAAIAWPSRARAQQATEGFAVERFYPSAPGGGWLVMDGLDMRGGFGGAISLTSGYAYKPLSIALADGSQRLGVVTHEAFADVGASVTYERFRLYLNLTSPLVVEGESGTLGGYAFSAPTTDAGSAPDTLSDARIGFDARIYGDARAPFRFGAGVQLIVPSGEREEYVSDGAYRVMARALFAGDVGSFTYAGQLGVHVRTLDDGSAGAPGSPRGSELLFGVAGGPRVPLCASSKWSLVVGPEIFGETAFKPFFDSASTGLEALATGRLEESDGPGPHLRLRVGTGGGLNAHFGAPEWRAVIGIEVFASGARATPLAKSAR